jgi:hypothetical protein
MTESEFLSELTAHIYATYGSMAKAGREWGLSPQMMHSITTGRIKPKGYMLDELKMDREEYKIVKYHRR